MLLEGSCHCARVRFSVESAQPYPFNRCYCSICRKTAGSGGYAINLGADNSTLSVVGREHVSEYQPRITDPVTGVAEMSPGRRYFCRHCGSPLWAWDPRWPELVHPHASAIDSELPIAPDHTHMMLASKANWVPVATGPGDRRFDTYPDESLEQWHLRHGFEVLD